MSGIVISVSLIYLSKVDEGFEKINKTYFWLAIAGILLLCPLVPVVLTIAYLVTNNEKTHEHARLSKCFAGFLDHGPHFVLRLVIVTLIGISQNGVYQR